MVDLININLFILGFYIDISIYYNRCGGIRLIVELFKENRKEVLFYVYYLNYGLGVINLKVWV